MERLIEIGKLAPKSAAEIEASPIGIGFEKLDRDVFDPEKAYDKLSKIGAKWVRIQSGWQRTEKEKGIYSFEWFDSIVDNLLSRGLQPWVCLCYGNRLYGEMAAEIFGAVGCPPINSDEAKKAWCKYVTALTSRYQGKITYYEIWNEPDGKHCWKSGVNAKEYSDFVVMTAKAIRKGDKKAKVIGGATYYMNDIFYVSEALRCGMGKVIDAYTFHAYTIDETAVPDRIYFLRALLDQYNPKIELIQGESGSQSRSGGNGALKKGAWTERKQAKQLLRHMVTDLWCGVKFTSYFSCMDMIEALRGKSGDVSSYLDYGYFGVLGAQFDENGFSIGEYEPKPSYYALQNLASLFSDFKEKTNLPILSLKMQSDRMFGFDIEPSKMSKCGFASNSGEKLFAYWYPANLMSEEYFGTTTLQVTSLGDDFEIIDPYHGTIYKIPESIMQKTGEQSYLLENLPVLDYPLFIKFKN